MSKMCRDRLILSLSQIIPHDLCLSHSYFLNFSPFLSFILSLAHTRALISISLHLLAYFSSPFPQFLYGEDGMDAQRIERQVFDSYGFTAGKFREIFFLDTSSDNFGQLNYTVSSTNETAYYLHRNVVERCRNDMGLRTIMEEEYEQLLKDREMLRYVHSLL